MPEVRYIDVHAHLAEPIFDKDRAEIVQECARLGILAISCGTGSASNRATLKLAKRFSNNLKAALGLYPTDALELSEQQFWNELKFIEGHAQEAVAIGEVGMDYHWIAEEQKRERQAEQFKELIWLANKLKLPLIVHSRKAERQVVELLAKEAHVPVVLHYFGGDLRLIKAGLSAGFYFSIAPIVVRSRKHQRLVQAVPLSRLLTETDAPYLGPTRERNDPRNIPLVVDKIAELKDMKVEKAIEQLCQNARALFKF